jgi:hypothetical protein
VDATGNRPSPRRATRNALLVKVHGGGFSYRAIAEVSSMNPRRMQQLVTREAV